MRTWIRIVAVASIMLTSSAAAQFERRSPLVNAIAKVQPAIVNIRTLRVVPAKIDNVDSGGRVKGLGTGILIDPRGYIITNYHVVEDVDEVRVLTADGVENTARIISNDERADLSMLKIDSARNFPYIPLWGSGEAILGESVIVIGNPFGLENSVSTGIVSAINRRLKLPNGEVYDDLIQTDAPINPGNSGGPLLNINGDLLGVNVAIRTNAQGIGFAIPTNTVKSIIRKMMAPDVVRAIQQQGLEVDAVDQFDRDAKAKSMPQVMVKDVQPGSPAAKAGFQANDQIVSVSGQGVQIRFDLERALWESPAGRPLVFELMRGEKPIKIQLPIATDLKEQETIWNRLGLRVRPVPAETVRGVYAKLNGGLLLTDVRPNYPGANARLRPGDILIGVHEWEMVEIKNILYVLQWRELPSRPILDYHVIRDGAIVDGKISVPLQ